MLAANVNRTRSPCARGSACAWTTAEGTRKIGAWKAIAARSM